MQERQRVPTGATWAAVVGYSRAVRVGDRVFVSGTAAVGPDGGIVHTGDAYGQAKRCLEIIQKALSDAGAGMEHVVRTRMYVKDARLWQDVGRAHAEFFHHVLPATTMVVTGFIDDAMLVEIEAEAIV
ncbi:MAG: RidA family protein [Gemmatimonadetes bacterium]|nr:RidA family protein [Gemmatimonadota bacterium]